MFLSLEEDTILTTGPSEYILWTSVLSIIFSTCEFH
jgi:hypothetical protein